MDRPKAKFDDGVCYVECSDTRLEVGEATVIVDQIGGETFTVEYDENAAQSPWLATDPDGTLTFEVLDSIDGMGFEESFVDHLRNTPLSEVDEDGVPHRTAFFSDMVTRMWDPSETL